MQQHRHVNGVHLVRHDQDTWRTEDDEFRFEWDHDARIWRVFQQLGGGTLGQSVRLATFRRGAGGEAAA